MPFRRRALPTFGSRRWWAAGIADTAGWLASFQFPAADSGHKLAAANRFAHFDHHFESADHSQPVLFCSRPRAPPRVRGAAACVEGGGVVNSLALASGRRQPLCLRQSGRNRVPAPPLWELERGRGGFGAAGLCHRPDRHERNRSGRIRQRRAEPPGPGDRAHLSLCEYIGRQWLPAAELLSRPD